MKNKRLLYVLFPLVLLVWGLIFQRIWSATQETGGNTTNAPAPAAASYSSNAPQRRPKLLLNYTDPFKGSSISHAILPTATEPVSRPAEATSSRPVSLNFPTAPPPAAAIPVVWPALKYLGSINNTNRNNGVALLNIDGKELMVKVGDLQQTVQVTRLYRDSAQVIFHGMKKIIKRSVEP